MKTKEMLLALFVFVAGALHAQEQKPLTLTDAIELSLRNSHQLKNSQAKIDEATAAIKEATQGKGPSAKVSGSYLRLNSANVKLKQQSDSAGGNTPNVNSAMYGLVNVSLPIYAGGKIRYGIESSRFLAEAARLDADNQKDEVVQTTIEAYINLYKAKSAVDLVKDNLAQNQQRVKDFTNLEKNGLIARNDLLKAELQASNTELTLLDVENNWALANVNMNLMLGLPTQTQLVPDTTIAEMGKDLKPLDEYVQGAHVARKDVAALSLQRKASETGIKIAKADQLPTLALSGGYAAINIPKTLTVTNAFNLGVGVSYDIASIWKNKAKVQQAEARTRQLVETEALVGDQVVFQVNQSYLNVLSSQKKIDVYAKAVEQAQENYRITKNKYDNALANTTDLLDADVAQLQAKLNYVFAKADAVVAYDKLLQTAGIPVQ